MLKKIAAFALGCIVILSGCASFKPNPTPKATLDRFKYQQTTGEFTVGIDPYFTPAKTMGVFDNDFKDHDMLAILIDASVPEENQYSITKSAVILKDRLGREFKPIDWKEAGDMVGRNYGYTVLWFFAGGIVGLIPSAIHTANINTKIEQDLQSREFKCGQLPARENVGFVYYNLEPYKHSFPKEMTANITIENIKTKEQINFSIPFEPETGF